MNQPSSSALVSPDTLRAFPPPDTEAVLTECLFLRATQSDPQYIAGSALLSRAAISILDKVYGSKKDDLIKGEALARKTLLSAGFAATAAEALIEQNRGQGPRTCTNIHSNCGEKSVCLECPHWGRVTSPIMIKGLDYIATEHTGFHKQITKENGRPGTPRPDYDGLRRFYKREHEYINIAESEICFTYNGTHWVQEFDASIEAFAQTHFLPKAKNSMAGEFRGLIARTEMKSKDFFVNTVERKMNFQNGVLDIDTMKFGPHSPLYGFRGVLPYEYNPKAKCERFQRFLEEVTLNRPELINLILEYAGYSLSNDSCWEQKAIVLQGEGRNGKSKLVTVIKALAGEGNSTALTLVDLEKDTNRYSLDGSLFNIAEETPSKSLMDSSLFKNLVSGGEISVKYLYKQPYTIRNKTKFWIICNEMPRTWDKSYAMFRRLVIVPFEATFTGEKEDKHIEEKLFAELPGIFNLVLAHYKKMKAQRGMSESIISNMLVEGYKLENDNVSRWFIEECEDMGPASETYETPQKMYDSYVQFVRNEGETPCAQPSFRKRISNVWKPYHSRKSKRVLRSGGQSERIVLGVRIKSEVRVVTQKGRKDYE